MLFHEWIAQELAKIKEKDYIEPSGKINLLRDQLVGVMSDGLKRLFTLWQRTEIEVINISKKYFKALYDFPTFPLPDEKAIDELMKKLDEVVIETEMHKERAGALKEVFLASLRDEFPIANGKGIFVCKNFQVVCYEEEKPPSLSHMLMKFVMPGGGLPDFSDN
jgi:hypothetical protein